MFGDAICGGQESQRSSDSVQEGVSSGGGGKLTFLCFGGIQVELSNRFEEPGVQEEGLGGEYKCENVYLEVLP